MKLADISGMIFEGNKNKTPIQINTDRQNALRVLDEKWRLRFYQLKQDYLLERRQLIERYNQKLHP